MVNIIITAGGLISFAFLVVSILRFLFLFFFMLQEINPKKQKLLNFIPFLALYKNSFNKKGREYYDKAFKSAWIAIISTIVIDQIPY
jgi:ABC-type spermidine/putrescine transport system permease subunit I